MHVLSWQTLFCVCTKSWDLYNFVCLQIHQFPPPLRIMGQSLETNDNDQQWPIIQGPVWTKFSWSLLNSGPFHASKFTYCQYHFAPSMLASGCFLIRQNSFFPLLLLLPLSGKLLSQFPIQPAHPSILTDAQISPPGRDPPWPSM